MNSMISAAVSLIISLLAVAPNSMAEETKSSNEPPIPSIQVAKSQPKSSTELTPVGLLNRRRTQMSLILFAPVMAEMLNRGEAEADGWIEKMFAKISGSAGPNVLFESRLKCVSTLLNSWQQRTSSGNFVSTREITAELLRQPLCEGGKSRDTWLDSIIGETSKAHVHGAYLEALMRTEERSLIYDQKLAHLAALQILTTRSGSQYPQAAQDIANYYREDRDARIVEKATDILRALPTVMRIRSALDIVRPDFMVAPVAGSLAAVKLIGRLTLLTGGAVTSTQATGAIATIGLHVGAIKLVADSTGKSRDGFAALPHYALSGPTLSTNRFNDPGNLEEWLPNLQIDPLPKSMLFRQAQRARRDFIKFGETGFELLPLLLSAESTETARNPFEVERLAQDLLAISAGVRVQLERKDIPFLDRVDLARKLVFRSGLLKKYVKAQPHLLPFVERQGGNCVSQTELIIGLFYPHRDLIEKDWQLAMETMPYHIQPTILNVHTGQSYDLMSGDANLAIENAFYHPAAYLEGYLRNVRSKAGATSNDSWRPYLVASPSALTSAQLKKFMTDSAAKDLANRYIVQPPVVALKIGPEPSIPAQAEIQFSLRDDSGTRRSSRGGVAHSLLSNLSGNYRNLPMSRPDYDKLSFRLIDNGTLRHEATMVRQNRFHFAAAIRPPEEADVDAYSEPRKLRGYTITFAAEADRSDVAQAASNTERAKALERLLQISFMNCKAKTETFTQMLEHPSEKFLTESFYAKDDYLVPAQRVLCVADIVEQIAAIEMLKSGEFLWNFDLTRSDMFDADHDAILRRLELLAMSRPEFRELLSTQMRILKTLTEDVESVLKIISNRRTNTDTRMLLFALYTHPSIQTGAIQQTRQSSLIRNSALFRYRTALLRPVIAMMTLIADPKKTQITDKINSTQIEPDSVVVPPATAAKFKLSARPRLSAPARNRGCPANDTSGRCREQNLRWIETQPSSVYLNPNLFFEFYSSYLDRLGNGATEVDEDRDFRIQKNRILYRWTQDMENLFVNNYADWALGRGETFGETKAFDKLLTGGRVPENFAEGLQPIFDNTKRKDLEMFQRVVYTTNPVHVVEMELTQKFVLLERCGQLRNDLMDGIVEGHATTDQAPAASMSNSSSRVYRECIAKIPRD